MKPFIALLAIAYFISLSFQSLAREGDSREPETSASLDGRVIDSRSGAGLGYASVVLFSNDTAMVAGTITEERGTFRLEDLKPGKYFLEIRYTGYKAFTISDIVLETGKMRKSLGEIALHPELKVLEAIQVSENVSSVTYHPDKQVINASQVPDGGAGTAASLLQNSPSVTVTNDNQVYLRGSSSFLLLIDGKIVMVPASDVLQQIPSSQVDRIEIITSPSAKHDAEGAAGIIHVILKKTGVAHTSGMVNLRVASYDKYNLDGGFRLKRKKMSWDLNAGWYNHKGYPISTTERNFQEGTNTRKILGDGRIYRIRDGAFLRSSLGWDPSPTASFNLWGDLSWFGFSRNTKTLYEDRMTSDSSLFLLSKDQFVLNGLIGNYGLVYRKTLDTSEHYIEARIFQNHWWGMNDNYLHRFSSDAGSAEIAKISSRSYEEDNIQGDLQTQVDYVKQWPKIRFETGLMVTCRPTTCDYETRLFDAATGIWTTDTLTTGRHTFDQTKYAGYGLLKGDIYGVSIQGGLRAEHYIRDFTLPGTDYVNHFEETYWFPSLHLSYELPRKGQLQAAFNRRISYPNDWSLTPNPFFSDGYTYQIGNPELHPELITNAEVSWQQYIGKQVITSTLYHRRHDGQIVRTVDLSKPPVMWMGFANLGYGSFTGLEVNTNLRLPANFSFNTSVNLYRQKIVTQIDTPATPILTNTWQIRAMLNYTIRKATKLQASLQYFGPEQEGTSERLAMYSINLSARHEFPGKKFSASLQISDILHTMVYRFNYQSEQGSSVVTWSPEYPSIALALTYVFNEYRQQPLPSPGQDSNQQFPL